ncbi:MAG: hypothetical protein RI885_906 [Actinomycetota bacterium]|jgi:D-inositol-3-phosphate glycosyltransferase
MTDRIALVSMHTSPTATAGTRDAGGMNVLLSAIAREMASRGAQVDLITRAVGAPRVSEVADGVHLHELAAGGAGELATERLVPLTDEFGEGVAALARRDRYSVIHAHYWLSGLATLPVALELGIPLVQSFHTVAALKDATAEPGAARESEQRLRSEMFLAKQASAIVAGSAAEATALIDLVGAPPDRLWVVPPGVDVDRFHPRRAASADSVRAALSLPAGRAILAVVGRVQPLKDQALAIRALAALASTGAPRPLLVVAGESTPGQHAYLEGLKDLAASLGVARDVVFAGSLSRDEVADLLAVASVTLVPSRSETFGLVALESAASGTPVVAFRGSGLMESVAHGSSGILVDSRDPADWARAVSSLLRSTGGELMSASARHHAEGYTWGATATALLGVYAALAPVDRGR